MVLLSPLILKMILLCSVSELVTILVLGLPFKSGHSGVEDSTSAVSNHLDLVV
jgi:hypothetical protein